MWQVKHGSVRHGESEMNSEERRASVQEWSASDGFDGDSWTMHTESVNGVRVRSKEALSSPPSFTPRIGYQP